MLFILLRAHLSTAAFCSQKICSAGLDRVLLFVLRAVATRWNGWLKCIYARHTSFCGTEARRLFIAIAAGRERGCLVDKTF